MGPQAVSLLVWRRRAVCSVLRVVVSASTLSIAEFSFPRQSLTSLEHGQVERPGLAVFLWLAMCCVSCGLAWLCVVSLAVSSSPGFHFPGRDIRLLGLSVDLRLTGLSCFRLKQRLCVEAIRALCASGAEWGRDSPGRTRQVLESFPASTDCAGLRSAAADGTGSRAVRWG